MTVDLAAIRARLAAATPGPWQVDPIPHYTVDAEGRDGEQLPTIDYEVYAVASDGPVVRTCWPYAKPPADADLIAHTPADLAALLDRCDQLEQAGNTLASALEDATCYDGYARDHHDEHAAALQAWRALMGDA